MFGFILYNVVGKYQNRNSLSNTSPLMVPGAFPIIGHLFTMGETPHLRLMEWAKQYGSV